MSYVTGIAWAHQCPVSHSSEIHSQTTFSSLPEGGPMEPPPWNVSGGNVYHFCVAH